MMICFQNLLVRARARRSLGSVRRDKMYACMSNGALMKDAMSMKRVRMISALGYQRTCGRHRGGMKGTKSVRPFIQRKASAAQLTTRSPTDLQSSTFSIVNDNVVRTVVRVL